MGLAFFAGTHGGPKKTPSDQERPHYEMVGDCGTNYGWAVNQTKYESFPRWRRILGGCRNASIVRGGQREEMQQLADQLNSGEMTEEEARAA